MKFWELISAFRSEKENLNSVLEKPVWQKFKVNFQNIEKLVNQQNRKILDEEIPFQLAKEVCEKSKLTFYLYYESNPKILTSWKKETDEKFKIFTPLDILLKYSGNFIEAILEKGSIQIKE